MDFVRLIAFAFWLLLSSVAHAQTGNQCTEYRYQHTNGSYTGWNASAGSACSELFGMYPSSPQSRNPRVTANNQCIYDVYNDNNVLVISGAVLGNPFTRSVTCPPPDPCGDKMGKLAEGTGCTAGVCAVTWQGAGPFPGPAGKMCVDGCSAAGNVQYSGSLGDGVSYMTTAGTVFSGTSCQPGDGSGAPGVPEVQPHPNPPPPGKCPGTVNGVEVLVDCTSTSNTTTSTSSVTTTTPDGNTSTTTTTTTTTTNCANGNCTTTTTVTGSGSGTGNGTGTGTGTTTTQTTEPQTEFCKKNPTAPACKSTESTFGGSCSSSFSCTGDAATCAIARATNEAKCQLTPSDGIKQVAAQLEAGTFAAALPNQVKNLGSFDTSDPFSTSCPSDYTLDVGLASVVIPFSTYCTVFQMMGNLLVAITLIWATVFVIRGLGGT